FMRLRALLALGSTSFSVSHSLAYRHLHSFPTRRSSDLGTQEQLRIKFRLQRLHPRGNIGLYKIQFCGRPADAARRSDTSEYPKIDRKSTRLNSSHVSISYAVFCLKKKKSKNLDSIRPRS